MTLDVSNLLTIDVNAELRKLCEALFDGPHQLPCELVRRSVRDRATSVVIDLGRRHLAVRHDGAPIPEERILAISRLLTPTAPDDIRHAALVAVEQAGDLPVIAALALGANRITIECADGANGHRLDLQPGHPPDRRAVRGPPGTTLTVHGMSTDPRQSLKWLRALCRFSPAQITVGGETIGRTVPRGLASRDLAPPLVGALAIPHFGDAAQVWLTEYGVVSAHVVIPRAPALEATVELGTDGPASDPVRVRDVFRPLEQTVIHQAIDILQRATPQLPDGRPRHRAAQVLLQGLKHGRFVRQLATVPAFSIIEPDGSRASADLVRVRDAVRSNAAGRILWALYPDSDPGEHLLPNGPVLIADDDERSALASLLEVRFAAPQPRPGGSYLAAFRRAVGARLRAVGDGLALLFDPGAGRPIAHGDLTKDELQLLCALHSRHDRKVAVLTRGAGPIRRRPRRPVSLPHENPTVAAAVAAHAGDPSWLYPASYALLGGAADPSLAAKARWRARDPDTS